MSAPRRPGDSRAGGRPDRRETRDDARSRRTRPEPGPKTTKDEPVAKPVRKARAEGWAKAKPPRDKPGRKFKGGKEVDRPTPMREDGPRRDDGDRLSARRDASARDSASSRDARADRQRGERAARSSGTPSRNRVRENSAPSADRPKRSFGDNARNRAAAAPRGPRDSNDVPRSARERSTTPATVLSRRREPSEAGAATEALGSGLRGRAVRSRADGSRTSSEVVRAERPARAPAGKATTGKQPNRAARRAELRAASTPAATPIPASAAAPPAPASDAPFLPGADKREPQRIAKLLARAGIASRREIERMIEERRIAIDGVPLETPATLLISLHGVTVDGKPVAAPTAARLFLFHKPAGVLTAERDFSGRPTIYDRLPEDLPRVVPVGRLDLNTEGLLLLTTDGELKRKLELPSTGLPRVYRARAYGDVTQQMLEDLSDGVEIEGIRYGPIDANIERRTGANVWVEMRITEGKNREVRRVLEYLGLQVSRLIRLAYGEFVLADLPPGGIVEVRQNDLVAFRQTLR